MRYPALSNRGQARKLDVDNASRKIANLLEITYEETSTTGESLSSPS